jgi:hypothetical protein
MLVSVTLRSRAISPNSLRFRCNVSDDVVEVAMAVGEIVAAHPVLVLEMADDGLDGRAAAHLSFDRRREAAFLF